MADKELNFEQELNRLKEIVNQVQQKEISIDESLKLYEEGKKIISHLEEELQKAESKVEKVIQINK